MFNQIRRLSHRVEADESSDLLCCSLDRAVERKARVPRSHVERERAVVRQWYQKDASRGVIPGSVNADISATASVLSYLPLALSTKPAPSLSYQQSTGGQAAPHWLFPGRSFKGRLALLSTQECGQSVSTLFNRLC